DAVSFIPEPRGQGVQDGHAASEVLIEGVRVEHEGQTDAGAGAEDPATGAFGPSPYAVASSCEDCEGVCCSSEESGLGAGLGTGDADGALACSASPATSSGPSCDVLEYLVRYDAVVLSSGGNDPPREERVAVAVRGDAVVGATWWRARASVACAWLGVPDAEEPLHDEGAAGARGQESDDQQEEPRGRRLERAFLLERAEAFESLQARFARLAAQASRVRELAGAREVHELVGARLCSMDLTVDSVDAVHYLEELHRA
ncbi:unnamed protein product, partial [Prorocentrum cordatum]